MAKPKSSNGANLGFEKGRSAQAHRSGEGWALGGGRQMKGRAIFKHWFVDFEFPNEDGEMVDSEMGGVPEGWGVGSILEIAELLSGGTPKTKIAEYWGGGIPWVSAKDVTNALGTFILDTEKNHSIGD